MQALADLALAARAPLLAAADTMAELDALLSLAVVAVQYNYVRPTLVDRAVLDIQGARYRHLLSLRTQHIF
jgi:DNA mismatch repair ATPase MutS